MVSVLDKSYTARTLLIIDDRFSMKILPCVETIEGEQPAEDLDLERKARIPYLLHTRIS